MGLDDPAIDWLEANLGMPKVESEEYLDEAFQAWVKREIKPTFTRKGHRDGRSGSKEVKTTTKIVRQLRYTPEEAEKEMRRLTRLYNKGGMKDGSFAAYRAHITRRTVAA